MRLATLGANNSSADAIVSSSIFAAVSADCSRSCVSTIAFAVRSSSTLAILGESPRDSVIFRRLSAACSIGSLTVLGMLESVRLETLNGSGAEACRS